MTNVKSIQRECLEGMVSVADAVSQIDEAIGGITRVDFKEGKKFKITNHTAMFGLDFTGLRRRQIDLLHGMAVLAYFQAQENGSIQPGEVHISSDTSTKHHRDGIYRIQSKYSN